MTSAASSRAAAWIKPRLYYLIAPLVALSVMALFEQTWVGQLLEDQTVNLRFKARAPFDPPADPRLVMVGIDQQSLDVFGRFPWPRSVFAGFLTSLAQSNISPHTIAFDILFTDPSTVAGQDDALGNATGLLPSVVTGALSDQPSLDPEITKLTRDQTSRDLKDIGLTEAFTNVHGDVNKIRGSSLASFPVTPLRKQSLFGFVNDEASKVDDVRHVIPLVMRVGHQVYPSLAVQTLCQMLDVDADKVQVNVGQNLTLRNSSGKRWVIPMNERGEYTINYRRQNTFNNLSFGLFAVALEQYAKGIPLPAPCQVAKKTLLIGEAATGLTDLGPTPLQAQSPLVYTHINVINNVLQNDYLSFVPWYWVVLGWSLVTWTTLLRFKAAPLAEAIFVPTGIAILYVVAAFAIFWLWSLQVALTWPVLSYGALNFGGVILRWREEQRGRQQIKQVFSRMLSPEVMSHLLDSPGNLEMGGSERPVTILFSDLRDFTRFSEGLSPAEVVRQLNLYFERMVSCVQEYQGTLHKYIGDAIMAAWGDIAAVSLGPEMDAINAVRAALMMRRELAALNEERVAQGLVALRIGMGLNHGHDSLVGLIGAASRSEFTVMGDPVNVASRLEGVTKEFHTDLAISETVHRLLGDDFLVRRLGFIQLKGRTQAILVYEVVAEKTEMARARMTAEGVAHYEAAFDHFLSRRFAEAEAGFHACAKEYPADYCIQNYGEASREFCRNPPPADWDGRIVMTTK